VHREGKVRIVLFSWTFCRGVKKVENFGGEEEANDKLLNGGRKEDFAARADNYRKKKTNFTKEGGRSKKRHQERSA